MKDLYKGKKLIISRFKVVNPYIAILNIHQLKQLSVKTVTVTGIQKLISFSCSLLVNCELRINMYPRIPQISLEPDICEFLFQSKANSNFRQ